MNDVTYEFIINEIKKGVIRVQASNEKEARRIVWEQLNQLFHTWEKGDVSISLGGD